MTAVIALLAFAVMIVWVMIGPSDEGEDEPVVEQEPEVAPAVAAAQDPVPAKKPAALAEAAAEGAAHGDGVDLFAGEMPDFMAEYHLRVLQKKKLGAHMQKELYNWGQENKSDARPQLILAWDSMNRDWEGIAVRMYRIAYRADSRAKDDPTMLRDLLKIAAKYDRTEYRETVAIIKEAYGEEALPRIDEAIAKHRAEKNSAGVDRLQRLKTSISGS